MFFFNPALVPYGVISADYSEYDSSLTYEEISNRVCEIFKNEMRSYCKNRNEKFPPELNWNEQIIILWRNVPDPTNGKVKINKTLELLCQLEHIRGNIYIRSIKDIVEAKGIEHLIHAISTLADNDRQYIFLDNEYFSYKPVTDIDISNLDEKIREISKALLLHATVGRVVSELDHLIEKPTPEPIDRFLEIYWKWQQAEAAVDICKQELGITHRTFYKYSQAYESTPYYCEHLKLFYLQICNVAKRGTLPEKEEYLKDMCALKAGQISNADVCKKYGLTSVIDIHRVKIALTERRRKAK